MVLVTVRFVNLCTLDSTLMFMLASYRAKDLAPSWKHPIMIIIISTPLDKDSDFKMALLSSQFLVENVFKFTFNVQKMVLLKGDRLPPE